MKKKQQLSSGTESTSVSNVNEEKGDRNCSSSSSRTISEHRLLGARFLSLSLFNSAGTTMVINLITSTC